MSERVFAVVPAGGSGMRMGSSVKKQFISLLGMTVLERTILALERSPLVEGIVLSAPEESVKDCIRGLCENRTESKITEVVTGGSTRQESVYNGVAALPGDVEYILVHDGARPFVTTEIIERVILQSFASGAAVAAVKVRDTLKETCNGIISGSINRDDVVRIQTPQCFRADLLKDAMAHAMKDDHLADDESSLVSRVGTDVTVVEGSETNIKLTTREDLLLGEAILSLRSG